MTRITTVFLSLAVFLCLCTPAFAAQLVTEDFSQLPDVSRVILSPDGKKLAPTIRINVDKTQGVAVQVINLETKEKKIALFTDNSEYFFNWIDWKDSKTLMAAVFTPSERSTQITAQSVKYKTRDHDLILIDTETDQIMRPVSSKFLSRYAIRPSVRNRVVDSLPDDPDHILMEFPGFDRGFMRDAVVYKFNIKTQQASVYQETNSLLKNLPFLAAIYLVSKIFAKENFR